MGWDRYEYDLRCETCGRVGKEIIRENDWMQREFSYENFTTRWVDGHHPGMKDAKGDYEVIVCPNCKDGGRVRRVSEGT
jgi:hypothetical protein